MFRCLIVRVYACLTTFVRSPVLTGKTSCSFVVSCCDRCGKTEQGGMSASIDLIYKRKDKRELVFWACSSACVSSWCCHRIQQENKISVQCKHAHTQAGCRVEAEGHRCLNESRKGGSFPSTDLLNAEDLLRACWWRSDLISGVIRKKKI